MKSRQQRKLEAKIKGVPFEPQYNTSTRINRFGEKITVGGSHTYEEAYGVGYERYNDKFVTIKEVEVETEVEENK